ncbi:hypothetical protein CONPUDRAFT_109849 [Coniophora puteana RWD-64-598 SS2]|uniref:Acyltransferase MbtK/IucB-like conserved domain-containing protein n=1 Tax=Coniophora puteana (strain RWD-64-598) TaxID=741705 RepID=A0A5M3MDH1_CONPW|nr:uncharacterized protein CONPUDRAFT_109849 [Coniophora puteana RWD-64-598 SS2]EIW77302.1 hypothetical protein CONPUDRAFT_109849 [Coniophora puteana RWD-64-598 SS2]
MRATFWQGAGTTGYHTRGWIPPSPSSPSFSDSATASGTHAYPPFPFVPSFTRTDTVIASHPLRPTKPAPGEVMYRKWCPGVEPAGAMLEFAHFDLGSSVDEETAHFRAFHKWHNDPRVNKGWNEQGSKEHHRRYLEGLNSNPNVIPMIMSWDGEVMGYVEFVWIKENHTAPYVPGGARDYDRGIHVLVGENKFRGFARTQAWHRALFHYCFLADPRTDRVIGEPKLDNPAILKVDLDSAMHFETIFDFPYKRSVLTSQPRERFFRLDLL